MFANPWELMKGSGGISRERQKREAHSKGIAWEMIRGNTCEIKLADRNFERDLPKRNDRDEDLITAIPYHLRGRGAQSLRIRQREQEDMRINQSSQRLSSSESSISKSGPILKETLPSSSPTGRGFFCVLAGG